MVEDSVPSEDRVWQAKLADRQAELAAWQDHYAHLRASHRDRAGSLSQVIVAVSGGGLGWSITVLEKISASPPRAEWALRSSWAFLVLSLVALVISLTASVDVFGKLVDAGAVKQNEAAAPAEENKAVAQRRLAPWIRWLNWIASRSASWIRWLNWVASIGAIIGLLLLIMFCSLNTHRERSDVMADEKTVKLVIERGEAIPLTQKPPTGPVFYPVAPLTPSPTQGAAASDVASANAAATTGAATSAAGPATPEPSSGPKR